MLTWPSIAPIFCCIGTSGGVKPPAEVVPDDDDEPQPATRASAAAPRTAPSTRGTRVCLVMDFSSPGVCAAGPERTWSVREGDERSPVEHHRDRLVAGLQWCLVALAGVGPGDGEARTGVELDDGVGAGPEVDDLADPAGRRDLVGVEHRPG